MRAFSKAFPVLLLAILAAILIGCGGGGGGGSSTDGSTNANANGSVVLSQVQIEAYDDGRNVVADPGSVRQGEVLDLRLWGRDNGNNVVVLPVTTTFSTNAETDEATLTNEGTLSITGNSGTFDVFATYRNNTYSLRFTIRSDSEAFIIGTARNLEGQGVPNAIVDVYANTGGSRLRSAVTGSNGTFRISVPTTARKFDVRFDNIGTRYNNVWGYRDENYSPAVCPAIVPLPTLTAGENATPLPNQIVLYRKTSTPPPVPSCELP